MTNNENKSVFEEVNPFPEKMSVSSAIDGGTDIDINNEDSDSILGELEEIALNDGLGGKSVPIDDEIAFSGNALKTKNAIGSSGSNAFDVESLAREIDSLNAKTPSVPELTDEDNEFLAVLGDDDRKMIDEVTRKTDGIEIDMFEPVGNLEENEDSVQLVVPENKAIGPVSLWKSDNDYYVTDVEGFGPETPSSILDHFEWKKEHSELSS
ncbi:MAG TPA: hypothetical protein PKK43_16525, partial [Spirochaetota bacterium]|nr:hypothetical protein [Spirochaetota bacterium]